MSAACVHCGGTGSLSKTLWGSLDCVHCGVADERTAYNAWQRKTMAEPVAPDEIEGWLIYQHGKAAALEQAAMDREEKFGRQCRFLMDHLKRSK